MPNRSDTPGHHSTGKKPYKPRPAKKSTPKKSTPAARPSSGLIESVELLDPERRSTAQERRRVIVEALRLSTRLAEDPSMPPSARTAALVQVKALSQQLIEIDEADHEQPPESWASRRPRAT